MNCYECHSVGGSAIAQAVCRTCGVALCRQHVHLEERELRRGVGVGKSIHELPARRVVCPVCRRAEHSG
ncbi:DUF2180 family protein [Streptomyces sp. QH1-20]|uniref:DUF2180 family protein n=1 Tax=Streptomyces sp. QH1-20 TaxID=3240934 RepID=UPI00351634B6